jgi:hypothetical protein
MVLEPKAWWLLKAMPMLVMKLIRSKAGIRGVCL